jgi:PAS domain S-box-containing protein
MEESQRIANERLHLAVQTGKMYVYEWDVNRDVIVRSPESADVLGFSQPVISRQALLAEVHPDDRAAFAEMFTRISPQSPTSQVKYRLLRPDGSAIWLEKTARAFFDDEGMLLRTVGVVMDITERKRAEETVRASEERYRQLVLSSTDWVWELDKDGAYTYVGPQCRDMLGYEPAELIGRKPIDLMPPEEARRCLPAFETTLNERKPFHGLESIRWHKDGHLVTLETSGVPISDKQGRFWGYRGMARDISERKRAENALREGEERFRQVANSAPVMIWMAGTDKLCTYFNQTWLTFTGRPIEAELGNGWTECVHPEDYSLCLETYTHSFDRREPFQMQYRLRRHDGEYRWLFDRGVPRFNSDGSFSGYIGSCIDVTDRKQMEEALANVGRRLIEAHEEERTWIARELHDDVNQNIALLAVELERWSQHLPVSETEIQEHIRSACSRLTDIAKDIQTLSHRLHSSKLEYLGLVAAANSFCKEFSQQHGVQIDFSHTGVPHTIPKEISLCLFRILQEALQNAAKHSGARRFKVELSGTSEDISLMVGDTGIGFDGQEAMHQQGLGLISMRERLQLVNGQLTITSRIGHGTTISAHVRLTSEQRMAG